jgi:hypothetical protein
VRIAIVGSRHYPELERVEAYVEGMAASDSLLTGGASGVDAAALRVARRRGLPVQRLAPSFEEAADRGRAQARNQRLVDGCDVLVAFWDGSSEGTRMTIERALDSGKEIHVFVASRIEG